MAGDLERARAVWRQGETVAGPSSLLGHTWAVLELRSGKVRGGGAVAGPSSLLGHTWAVLELRSGKCV